MRLSPTQILTGPEIYMVLSAFLHQHRFLHFYKLFIWAKDEFTEIAGNSIRCIVHFLGKFHISDWTMKGLKLFWTKAVWERIEDFKNPLPFLIPIPSFPVFLHWVIVSLPAGAAVAPDGLKQD